MELDRHKNYIAVVIIGPHISPGYTLHDDIGYVTNGRCRR